MSKEFLLLCQREYYKGSPLISNEEYDALALRFGEDYLGEGGEFKHMFRMYSLDKVYPCRGDSYPLPLEACVKTKKLDGCATSLLYINGNLTQGNTRGDGISSPTTFESWKLEALGIPQELSNPDTFMQITGEVVNTRKVPNERNYASGAMQLKDKTEFLSRVLEGGLIFVAYGLQISPNRTGKNKYYHTDMDYLSKIGFKTVMHTDLGECPTDGLVYRLDSNEDFFNAGFTHKHPKGAFAEKEDEEGVETTLLDVVWATGKTGKVTPTAIFEEIIIDDAKISRATLNNAGYLEAMGLEIGDRIKVIRSGGIIPKIIGKV